MERDSGGSTSLSRCGVRMAGLSSFDTASCCEDAMRWAFLFSGEDVWLEGLELDGGRCFRLGEPSM